MTVPAIKVKVRRKSVVRGRAIIYVPGLVTVDPPLLMDRSGGGFHVSLETDALLAILDNYYTPVTFFGEPQVVTGASGTVGDVMAVAVNRTAPSATSLALPSALSRSGKPLHVFDYSTSVTDHTITLTPNGTEKIMRASSWPVYSNSAQLGSVTLYPSSTLGGWYIAP